MYKVQLYEYGQTPITVMDPLNGINFLTEAQLEKSEDAIDSLTLSIHHWFLAENNITIKPMKTLVKVYNTKKNKLEFVGRVMAPDNNFDSSGAFSHTYVFEGALAFLMDSVQKYSFEFDKMPVDNLKLLIDHHNAAVSIDPYKRFVIGTVDVPKNTIPAAEEYNEELKYFKRSDDKDTWASITDDLIGKYGGHIVPEYREDDTIIHYLKETGVKKATEIIIGKNLKSLQQKVDPTEIITRVKPLGASSETANGDEIRLTISDVNNGSAYIDIPELIALYGIQEGVVDFPEKYTPSTLKEAALKWIDEQNKEVAKVSITIDALDLSLIGLDPDDYDLFNIHRTKCEPLEIDEDLKIVGISIDLMNPQNKSLTIGEKKMTLDDIQAQRESKVIEIIEKTGQDVEAIENKVDLKVPDSPLNEQMKLFTNAVNIFKQLATGIELTSSEHGLLSSVSIKPYELALISELINLNKGQVEITKGETRIKNAVINDAHIDRLTLNVLQGGVLDIGGYTMDYLTDSEGNIVYQTITDDEGNETTSPVLDPSKKRPLPDGVINIRDTDGNIVFQISAENKGADKFTVQDLIVENKIQNDYIVSKSTDGMKIEVLGLDAREIDIGYNDETGIYKTRTINEAIDILPDVLGTGFFINVLSSYASSDPSEHIILKSKLGGGFLDIDFNAITSTARFSIDGCQCRVTVKNGNFNVLDDEKNYMIQNYYSHYVTFENLSFNGNNAPDLKGINCYGGGNTYITGCDIQNVTDCVSASYLNSVYMFNNTGQGTRYGAIAWRGSNININGKAPLGKANNASTSYAGNINTTDATYPEPAVTKQPTTVSTTKTKTFKTSKANHYRYSGYNSWARSGEHHYGYPVQGQGYGSPLQVGIWLGLVDSSGNSMKSVLSGKTIKSIKVKLTRRSKIGNTSDAKVNLRMHKYSTQPSGAPSFSSASKEIILDWSESKTVDVTSTFKSLINQNTYAGFGIKVTTNDVAHYAELSKYLEVTVVYV